MVPTQIFLQILGINLCLVIFSPSLTVTVHRSFTTVASDGRELDILLLTQECISKKLDVPPFPALTISLPVEKNWKSMTSNTSQNGKQAGNGIQPEYNHLVLLDHQNLHHVPCQVRQSKLTALKQKLKSISTAIRAPVSLSHNKQSPHLNFNCFFPFVTTVQEIHNYINGLFQAQQDGERFFQNLTKFHNAELMKRNQSHVDSLTYREDKLKSTNCEILEKIKTTEKNLKAALMKNESLHFLSTQHLEIEEKFKSICQLLVETPEVIDPRPQSEFDEPADEGRNDDVQPLFNTNCFIFHEDLKTIQILAEKSTQLIIAIFQNNFDFNFKNITRPADGTGTKAQCESSLINAYNAVLQLKKNTNRISANPGLYQNVRVANTIKAHNTQILNVNERFRNTKNDLEKKYGNVRFGLLTLSENLNLKLAAIDDQNLKFKYEEVGKIRQLAKSLVKCNESASAAHAIQQFYCGFKSINEYVPFYNFTYGINLSPLDITALKNCEHLSKTNTSRPSVVRFSAQVLDLVRNCSSSDENPRMCSDKGEIVAPDTLNNWADAIMQNSYEHIFSNFSREYLKCTNTVFDNVAQLIGLVCAKKGAKSLKNLLGFVAALEMPIVEASAYLQIFEIIHKTNGIDGNSEICELAWRVKNTLLTPYNTEDRIKLELIKHGLPKNIQRLVFSPNDLVIISNKHSAGHSLAVNESGNLCINPVNGSTKGKIQKWKVLFIDYGRYFSFENERSGKILFQDTDEPLRVQDDTQGAHREQWEVSTYRNGSSVRIKNRHTGNLLSGRYLENC